MINRLVNGILIVLVGAILLMNTTGALPWSVWDAAIGYWPILIIGLGIQVVLSKWQVPGLSLALIVVLVISALYPYYGASPFSPNPRMRMFFRNVPVSRPLQHTRELEVPLHRAVSRLGIEMVAPSLDIEAKGDPALSMPASEYAVLGELSWDKHEPVVEVSPEQSSANLQITVKSPVKEGKDAGRQMWDLRFNPSRCV